MQKVPGEIGVWLPDNRNDSGPQNPIPIYTLLFRKTCCLPEALQQTYARSPNASELTILSAACSIGAETDSLIALHEKNGSGETLNVIGFDINPIAIRAAKAGLYRISNVGSESDYYTRRSRAIQTIKEYGFSEGHTSGETVEHFSPAMAHINGDTFNSNRLRRQHAVEFQQVDLSYGKLPEVEADLISASNLLYHLSPSEAWKVVSRLAGLLKENGVLNLSGSASNIFTSEMLKRRDRIYSGKVPTMRYDDWIQATPAYLESQFDLKLIPPEAERQLMFSRV